MSLSGYTDILQGPLAQYLQISEKIGGDVAEQSKLVSAAFEAQLLYLKLAAHTSKPPLSETTTLLSPTSQQITAVQEYREKHRTSPFFMHLSAISESVTALAWVTVSPAPAPFVKEMNDAGQYYTNRVLKDWKEKDKNHVDWQHHTTGLVWAGTGPSTAPPPPPFGSLPPPPAIDALSLAAGDAGLDRSALFAEINCGQNVTKNLKRVTADMQTHKNTALRQGPAPFKPVVARKPISTVLTAKPPVFTRDGKKWLIEYQKNKTDLVVEDAEMNNVVYLFKCENSTVQVRGKINSITMDSCKKTSIVFDNLVSSMEFINCQSVQMQVMGKVPTVSIDKTDGCQVYLSNESLDVEIISSKSSEMNILLPKGDDYVEHAVPEQYKTRITPNKTLHTEIVENKG
ncbi:hypothetical protein HUJ04_008877 [Dendroctonus ponderosae]|nr:hypothetical protein HUJ04_008877 [Dendroctonus ponderosae]KAH1002831.1 hypothetical protein HUJ04_008877 [Dendroctonus ponderosae]KAH1002833.1 hypothetical protein HUJ04_008877 [Dendroctonus ponderosae]